MKYPPWLVAAVVAAGVSVILQMVGWSTSPCGSSVALRLEGVCGPGLLR